MAWQQPITIRTAAHAAARHPRCGVLGADGFNRIEGNTAYLAGLLGITAAAYTGWQVGSLVFERDMLRVRDGLEAVRKASRALHLSTENPHWMPEVPELPLNDTEKLNRAEAIQLRALRAASAGKENWQAVEASGILSSIL